MSKKIIIIGGVAGGATSAARLRRLDEESQIIMFERGEHISFANCGLPYYLGDVITKREKLLVQTVSAMSKRYNLDIRNFTEIQAINKEEKYVVAKNLSTGETYKESYDKLILSPGAKPFIPSIPGIQSSNVFTLRNMADNDTIKAYLTEMKPSNITIIGGGFIGLEMAENLKNDHTNVTVIEKSNQLMAPLDFEMAQIVHKHLKDKGVKLLLENSVVEVKNAGKTLILETGEELPSDLTILSIGVRPETNLATEAGLKIGGLGGIQVNEYFQTSDENIYAIGDAIEVIDFVSQESSIIPLAGPANRQARMVANHIYEQGTEYKGTLGTAVAKIFDLTVATTGLNEKQLNRKNMIYEVIHIHPANHATYYPGAFPISLKLLFCPTTGTIYGAQAVGKSGTEKRIDVIATAIYSGLTVEDLQELELSYAPPFSSAKDPVNMAGYVAGNILDGVETVQWHEIDEIVENGGYLVDVRNANERDSGFIPGSINIPLDNLREQLDNLPKDKTIYVSCQVGLRGYLAYRLLTNYGFDVVNVDGGYKTYSVAKGL